MIVRPKLRSEAEIPGELMDVDGCKINVNEICKNHALIFIIFKAYWCPSCSYLVRLLKFLGLDDCHTSFPADIRDEASDKVYRIASKQEHCFIQLLLGTDARFVIVVPGPQDLIRDLKRRLDWKQAMIADEEFSLIKQFGLEAPHLGGAWPSIVSVKSDSGHTSAEEVMIGRAAGFYGENHLLNYLSNERKSVEMNCLKLIEKLSSHQKKSQELLCRIQFKEETQAMWKLPTEIWNMIFQSLSSRDIQALALSNKSIFRLCFKELIYRESQVLQMVESFVAKKPDGGVGYSGLQSHSFPRVPARKAQSYLHRTFSYLKL